MKIIKGPKNVMFRLFKNIRRYEESKDLKPDITKPTILQSNFE